ncbi:MAG: HypC/HybG/HupF family hydrogenase formation chaperone [Acidimicrobiia bacterium]|nr:HypC/HybG/HupF family hydrogenase formation chaperone [Acidimicrobiia bacterium]
MCLGAIGVIHDTWDEGGVAMASVAGEPVCLMYTPEAKTGDSVLVHLGFAIEILDEERAAAATALRSEMTEGSNA